MAERKLTSGADKAGAAPASRFDPSGAPIQSVPDVDPSHPAVDNHPRADGSKEQNKVDFNNPTLTTEEAVENNLAHQAKG